MCPAGLPVSGYFAFCRKVLVLREELEKVRFFFNRTYTHVCTSRYCAVVVEATYATDCDDKPTPERKHVPDSSSTRVGRVGTQKLENGAYKHPTYQTFTYYRPPRESAGRHRLIAGGFSSKPLAVLAAGGGGA